jgi:uncharacterized lipoprotein YddW (UPF0748 family)
MDRRMHQTQLIRAAALLLAVAACTPAGRQPAPAPSPRPAPAPVPAPTPAPADLTPPAIVREMRGLWVATVANIDWPSRNSLTAAQQRAELTSILDRAAGMGLNAIILQVRPASDAVYRSELEPWAALLTGTQGTDPGYDPLEFAVTEAHRRGLELHAWINPFRAGNAADSTRLAPTHLMRTRRDLVRVYGAQLWLDPGEAAVHDHVVRVVTDIVRRYDIDAIHADDYFYPYPQRDAANRRIDFPDSATFARSGSTLARDDWRRQNVDRFVERLRREVQAVRPTVRVGISPFGIWRPGVPAGTTGLDAYAEIYADARRWLREGWVDYMAPQLYWRIDPPQQSFPVLLDWWIGENLRQRHVWPGLAAYRVADASATPFDLSELPRQVALTRQRTGATGHLLYNTTATLQRNAGALGSTLARDVYGGDAVPPAFGWLATGAPPAAPSARLAGADGDRRVELAAGAGTPPRWWVVRTRFPAGWTTRMVRATTTTLAVQPGATRMLVTSMDAAGVLGGTVDVPLQ